MPQPASRSTPAQTPPTLPGWEALASDTGATLLARAGELRVDGAALDQVGLRLRREGADPDVLAAVLTVGLMSATVVLVWRTLRSS